MTRQSETIFAVGVWGIAQTILLLISVSGVQLWFHQPVPAESIALSVMVCGQILLSAVLLPAISRGVGALLINLVLTLAFDLLAGSLSSVTTIVGLRCFGIVGLWYLGLEVCWMRSGPVVRRMICAAALLFTAGGALLDYVRFEAAAGSDRPVSAIALLTLAGNTANLSEGVWIESAIPLLVGAFMIAIYRRHRLILHFPPPAE